MAAYIRSGGHFSREAIEQRRAGSHLIAINVFPDGLRMIHDGHHRCVGALLGGRDFLYPEEYGLQYYSYESYNEVNPAESYYTPFDVLTEVRQGDFKEYKDEAVRLWAWDPHGDGLREWVEANRWRYCEARLVRTAEELADAVGEECGCLT